MRSRSRSPVDGPSVAQTRVATVERPDGEASKSAPKADGERRCLRSQLVETDYGKCAFCQKSKRSKGNATGREPVTRCATFEATDKVLAAAKILPGDRLWTSTKSVRANIYRVLGKNFGVATETRGHGGRAPGHPSKTSVGQERERLHFNHRFSQLCTLLSSDDHFKYVLYGSIRPMMYQNLPALLGGMNSKTQPISSLGP